MFTCYLHRGILYLEYIESGIFFFILNRGYLSKTYKLIIFNLIFQIYFFDSYEASEEEDAFIITSLYLFFAAILTISFALGVVSALGFLLYVQLKIVLRNKTGIEEYICNFFYFKVT